MKSTRLVVATAGLVTAAVQAQPGLTIRFDNGSSAINVAPGAQVPVHVFVTGMPDAGTNIPWTTPPGTGQLGLYAGFLSVLFDVRAVTTGTATWSQLEIAPPFNLMHANAGTIAGPNVNGINLGVQFNPPVTGNEFLLWSARVTVGAADVSLSTLIRPTGAPPQTGLEVALAGIIPGLNVSHFVQTANGSALITVPAPAALATWSGVVACAARRRRRS